MKTITKELTYNGTTKLIHFHFYTTSEFERAKTEHGITVWYDTPLPEDGPGGFVKNDPDTPGYDIHLKSYNRRLIAHEIGHVFGIHHPNDPVKAIDHAIRERFPTMAFTGLLRWRDPEGLLPLADEVLRDALA